MNLHRTVLMIFLNIIIISLSSYTVMREYTIHQSLHRFIIYLHFIMILLVFASTYFTIRARILFVKESANPNPEPIDPAKIEAHIQMMKRIRNIRKYAYLIVFIGSLIVITIMSM